MSAGLALYRAAVMLADPVAPLLLGWRLSAGREDKARIGERLGRPSLPRPAGQIVWFHTASVGEATAALPLIEALVTKRKFLSILVTTVTKTAAAMLADRLPDGALHQYVPIDTPAAVRRFLAHWRPDLAIWLESELWPTLLTETRRAGVPTVLLNGRMSERSARRWAWAPDAAASLLGGFVLCLATSRLEADRLTALGAVVKTIGNLKDAAVPLPVNMDELGALRDAIGTRPVWMAASTHPSEEEAVAAVHVKLASGHPRLLTIVAPRHPERGSQLALSLRSMGLRVTLRSEHRMPVDDTDIMLIDTIGELGLFFRVAGIAFVGGSLVPHGGHNVLEPARLGCAVLYGPHMENFIELAEAFEEARAALQVETASDLAAVIDRLLAHPEEREMLGGAARGLTASRRSVGAAILDELEPFLAFQTPTAGSRAP